MKIYKSLLMAAFLALASLIGSAGLAVAETDVMDKPMDGTSVEAFETDMEKVKIGSSEEDYKKLKSAIGYLLYYDLSVQRDKARLYQKLDGKTATEVIAMMK